MAPLSSPTHSSSVDRISVPAPGAEPEAFLSAFGGRPRGFWGRGNRWVAWAGRLEELCVEEGETVESAVARVRIHLSRLQGKGDGAREEEPQPPFRLFGGFHFASGRGAREDHWAGFPAARFILPELLLEQGTDGPRLTLQWHAKEAVEDGYEPRLADLLARIRGGGTPGTAPASSPSVRPSANGSGSGTVPGTGEAEAREAWSRAVARILDQISGGGIEKVVLARIRNVVLPEPLSIPDLLGRLRSENGRSHVFLFEPEPGNALVGAAPEVLAELRNGRFHASAVAGSIARGKSPEEDRFLADRLLASHKDLAEHRHTVEVMREGLSPLLRELEVGERPRVLTLERIQHLETRFDGWATEGVDVLEMVRVLHPTPAVCGRPRGEALRLIGEAEPFQRGWYAGPVGWVDVRGDGDFVPALRSAVGDGGSWRLFAGAGIVDGSEADAEWEETGLKFEPVLRALGVLDS